MTPFQRSLERDCFADIYEAIARITRTLSAHDAGSFNADLEAQDAVRFNLYVISDTGVTGTLRVASPHRPVCATPTRETP